MTGRFPFLPIKGVLDLLKEGHHGVQVERDKTHAVWASREEKEGRVYAALFNFCEEETEVSVSLEDLYASVSAANEEGAKLTAEGALDRRNCGM